MKLKICNWTYFTLVRLIALFGIGVLLYDVINAIIPLNKILGIVILILVITRYISALSMNIYYKWVLLISVSLFLFSLFFVKDISM